MSDKTKPFTVPTSKMTKTKRPLTASSGSGSAGTSSRIKAPIKEKLAPMPPIKPKFNKNITVIGDADTTIMKQEPSMPDFDGEYRQIAYGKFMRAMLEECLVDEKIEREETHMDIQMAQLTKRFQETMDVLDKTNRRLKDVSFVVEQKRLLDLKKSDSSRFYEMTDSSNAQEQLHNLNVTEQACLDKLETKNIDFGFDKESGHKQLLDAVNDAIEGLEQIKKHSHLDKYKFMEYEKSQRSLEDLERDMLDLTSLKTEFEGKFPKFSEKLIKEASEKITKMFENTDVDD